jgi:hypothetical protein
MGSVRRHDWSWADGVNSLKAPLNDPSVREQVFDRLMETVAEAVLFAVSGDAGAGHRRLMTALRRAEKAHRRQEPWSEESLAYYRHVIRRYEERFFTNGTTSPLPAEAPHDPETGRECTSAAGPGTDESCALTDRQADILGGGSTAPTGSTRSGAGRARSAEKI